MNPPILTRGTIPFFHDKTAAEFRNDTYERYHEVVLRYTALHLADEQWGGYPYRPLVDWALANLPAGKQLRLADVGCGVGRLAGEVAQSRPTSQVWGLDFSYQMLRRAQEYWVNGETLELDYARRGFAPCRIAGLHLPNLQFGLAKAEALPFAAGELDAVLSTFLLDRAADPALALREMWRVLRPGGRLLLASPLNFQRAEDWQRFHPAGRLIVFLQNLGWKLESWQDDWQLTEPLDARGNHLVWNCLGLVATKLG